VKDHEETAEESNEEADKDEKPDEKEEKSDDDGEAEEEKSNENAEKDDSEDDKHDGATSNPDIGKASDGKSTEPVKSTNHKVEGVQFKGKTNKGDDNNEMHDTRKIESDGKGGMRKRIDSGYQKDLGAGDRKNEDGSPSVSSISCIIAENCLLISPPRAKLLSSHQMIKELLTLNKKVLVPQLHVTRLKLIRILRKARKVKGYRKRQNHRRLSIPKDLLYR